ncbi:MAG: hypothetical protein JNL92_21895 [Opitutaceae bacterium]|nr:hypothetical protein [Opitutaceae bacterium]
MYPKLHPITPSQAATNGALDIFVEGFRLERVPQMLIGLSVLGSATAAQVHAAMTVVQASRGVSRAEIEAMLAA